MPLETDAVFTLAQRVAVEYFDCGALLLNLRSRTLAELDAPESWVLRQLDGQRAIALVAEDCAEAFALTYEKAAKLVWTTCERLLREQFLRLVQGSWNGDAMDTVRYIQNPDVNVREEDEDGALLFNPDTDRVQLLNSTGFYIWKLCAEGRTVSEIIASFKNDYAEVPEDEVTGNVEEYMTEMVDAGFIGMLKTL